MAETRRPTDTTTCWRANSNAPSAGMRSQSSIQTFGKRKCCACRASCPHAGSHRVTGSNPRTVARYDADIIRSHPLTDPMTIRMIDQGSSRRSRCARFRSATRGTSTRNTVTLTQWASAIRTIARARRRVSNARTPRVIESPYVAWTTNQ